MKNIYFNIKKYHNLFNINLKNVNALNILLSHNKLYYK